MKIGKFKIKKVYLEENGKMKIKWGIFGRKMFGFPWVLCFDTSRTPPNLVFDLEYDACGYLQGFVEWEIDQNKGRSISVSPKQEKVKITNIKNKNTRIKRHMAKISRRKNRIEGKK